MRTMGTVATGAQRGLRKPSQWHCCLSWYGWRTRNWQWGDGGEAVWVKPCGRMAFCLRTATFCGWMYGSWALDLYFIRGLILRELSTNMIALLSPVLQHAFWLCSFACFWVAQLQGVSFTLGSPIRIFSKLQGLALQEHGTSHLFCLLEWWWQYKLYLHLSMGLGEFWKPREVSYPGHTNFRNPFL